MKHKIQGGGKAREYEQEGANTLSEVLKIMKSG